MAVIFFPFTVLPLLEVKIVHHLQHPLFFLFLSSVYHIQLLRYSIRNPVPGCNHGQAPVLPEWAESMLSAHFPKQSAA